MGIESSAVQPSRPGGGPSLQRPIREEDPMRAFTLGAVLCLAAAALPAAAAPSPFAANCTALALAGDPRSANGARWTYASVDDGIAYALEGVVFVPTTPGPYAGVVVSHGKGGSPYGYSASVARVMRGWGVVAIATMYAHAPAADDAGNLPAATDGASAGNVLRAHKARDLLSCFRGVDRERVAAHGHSMGAFVTGELLGTYPEDFRAASQTAGGVSDGPNATHPDTAARIVTPFQVHHSEADTTVPIAFADRLVSILAAHRAAYDYHVAEYTGYSHAQMALDPPMLERVRAWYQEHGVLP
jgi:dienelactone hydrolase